MATQPIRTAGGNIKALPEINYPLVEATRPALYRAMKYWGKKPHNIWAQYIERYCPPGGIVCDPFVGSGIAALEAAKLGRKAIAFDLNPLCAFFIEVMASPFDEEAFLSAARGIRDSVQADDVYLRHYRRERDGTNATVLNYRWEHDNLVGVAIERPDRSRRVVKPDDHDLALAQEMSELPLTAWHPTTAFPNHPSVNRRFIRVAGGADLSYLWTRRNLHLLSVIFARILAIRSKPLRLQLLSAFVQALHLCSKMVIPRNQAAQRDYSGSWGRPDFIIRRRKMEQNPVDLFWRSCAGRQGVLPMMRDAASTFPNGLDIHDARAAKKLRTSATINYGAVDVADLTDYIKKGSVDFVITDPPYAGLVRYLPLSLVWLCWLEHADPKYKPDLAAEITVNKTPASRTDYRRRLRNAFEQMHRILADDGRLVVTFHHQDVREFNDFVLSVKQAGFVIDKVTHQYNRRSGESNVANPYGVSGSDFYVRCVKRRDIDFTEHPEQLGTFIVQKAAEIIGARNEPTPYNFLFEALWPELLQAGFTQPKDSSNEIKRVLAANEGPGKIFVRSVNPDTRVGDLWWFNTPATYINHPDRPLRDRVADSVLAYLRRRVSVKLDDVIAELFREYPNGLTPDPRTVRSFLERYAFKSQGKWKISPEMVIAATQHSDTIATVLRIGDKMGLRTFVGRREQHERTTAKAHLRELANLKDLHLLRSALDQRRVERLEMVDVVFLAPALPRIVALWEVENTTNFSSAIQRGSNAAPDIPKFMIIPDQRQTELSTITDPLFRESFAANSWRYLTYIDLARLAACSTINLSDLLSDSKGL